MSEGQEPERTKEEIERRKVCIEKMIYEYVYGARKRA